MGGRGDGGRNMAAATGLTIRFWGVRGSFPVPGPSCAEVGGNSSCVEVEAGGQRIIFDAGTGLIGLGARLIRRGKPHPLHLFLSHLHYDHIEGIRFFKPLYRPAWACTIYGPDSRRPDLTELLAQNMSGRFFPVDFRKLPAQVTVRPLGKRDMVVLPGTPEVRIETEYSAAHPTFGVQFYRLTCGRRSIVYATDVEAPKGGFDEVVRFAKGADVLIHDAQYTDQEYFREVDNRQGWGHSTVRMAAEAARAAEVGQLVLYHHDPTRKDTQMPPLLKLATKIFPNTIVAREGLSVRLRA